MCYCPLAERVKIGYALPTLKPPQEPCMSSKIPVGISACLMGEKVRFAGGYKRLAFAMDDLARLSSSPLSSPK